jgi:transposase
MPPTSKIVRAVKFAVTFPGRRRADMEGKTGLFYELARMQGELTRAANQVVTALYQVELGVLPRPVKEDGSPVSSQTLAYQALSGSWLPFGPDRPIYRPQGRRYCGGGLSELASSVHVRMKTDLKDVRAGVKSLPTFKLVPLMFRATEVTPFLGPDGRVFFRLHIWGGRDPAGNNKIVVAPVFRPRDTTQNELVMRILRGEYTHGSGKLFRDKQTGKWTFSLSWSSAVKPADGPVFAGVDLGIIASASVAFVSTEDGAPVGPSERIQLPETAIRSWNRVEAERKARQRQGALIFARREGKGRHRKLRPIEVLAGKRDRIAHTAVEETAAAVVRAALKRRALGIAFEDLTGLTSRVMEESAGLNQAARALRRRFFLNGLLHAMRTAVKNAAEKEGLYVAAVPPAYTNRTCSGCGKVWAEVKDGFGRVSFTEFKCDCGQALHAHRNAALNIARRGLEEWRVAQAKAKALGAIP